MIVAGKVVAYDNSSAAYSRMVVAIGMSSKLSASVLLQFQLVVEHSPMSLGFGSPCSVPGFVPVEIQ